MRQSLGLLWLFLNILHTSVLEIGEADLPYNVHRGGPKWPQSQITTGMTVQVKQSIVAKSHSLSWRNGRNLDAAEKALGLKPVSDLPFTVSTRVSHNLSTPVSHLERETTFLKLSKC